MATIIRFLKGQRGMSRPQPQRSSYKPMDVTARSSLVEPEDCDAVVGDVEVTPAVRRRLHTVSLHRTADETADEYIATAEEYIAKQSAEDQERLQKLVEDFENAQKDAKEYIVSHFDGKVSPGQELLSRAQECVEADWLGDINELSGNFYRIAAFGQHKGKDFGKCSEDGAKALIRYIGLWFVLMAQLLGPPAICLSTVFAWGMTEDKRLKWEKFIDADGIHIDLEDWHHVALTKVLSIILICLFCLNATYSLFHEVKEWGKIDDIFQYLQILTPHVNLPGEKFLFLGGLVNCWVVTWCCVDAYVIIGGSRCPKDCVMDSLGLMFLFNMDDIAGALGFVSAEAWPGQELGWIHKHMVKKGFKCDVDAVQRGCGARTVKAIFIASGCLTGIMAISLPLLSAVTPWLLILP